jgi:hypothetical protein
MNNGQVVYGYIGLKVLAPLSTHSLEASPDQVSGDSRWSRCVPRPQVIQTPDFKAKLIRVPPQPAHLGKSKQIILAGNVS